VESEKERLVAILSANQWNILRVAKLIGVTRRTVYLRMQRWGIERKKPKKTLKPFLQGA
jgi:transcriptional regulator of acetoin/glycerol metabolism